MAVLAEIRTSDLPAPTARATRPVAASFEFFPPNDPEMEQVLWNTVRTLAPFAPRFVSVTYGADGSTRDRTREVVRRLRAETDLVTAPHITSSGGSRQELLDLVRDYWRAGIRHLVALRGDAPAAANSAPSPFAYARGVDLVRALRSVADFDISVAAYPEVHPEAQSARDDLDNLKRKIDAGATRAITQFFFDNSVYLRFRDACVAAGITVPIVPGILPINRFTQVQRFARRCGASVPPALVRRFEALDDSDEARRALGAEVAIEQVLELRRQGTDSFHLYTLNRADLSVAVCRALGLGPCADGIRAP